MDQLGLLLAMGQESLRNSCYNRTNGSRYGRETTGYASQSRPGYVTGRDAGQDGGSRTGSR
jgi:hypothetical protein